MAEGVQALVHASESAMLRRVQVFLLHVHHFRAARLQRPSGIIASGPAFCGAELPPSLVALLCSRDVPKVGLNIRSDFLKLVQDGLLPSQAMDDQGPRLIDLHQVMQQRDALSLRHRLARPMEICSPGMRSLAMMVASVWPALVLEKGCRLTNWEVRRLSTQQALYAALDAAVALRLYWVLSSLPVWQCASTAARPKAGTSYYVILNGRSTGIVECNKAEYRVKVWPLITGFPGAKHRRFDQMQEAIGHWTALMGAACPVQWILRPTLQKPRAVAPQQVCER